MSIEIVQNSNTPSILSSATAIASRIATGGRRGWGIQNLGINALFVRMGDTASTTVFHIVLKAGTADDDGLGGSYEEMNGSVFQGLISVAGTTPRYVIREYI